MPSKGRKATGARVRDHASTSCARSGSSSRTSTTSQPESNPSSTNQGENELQSISHAGSNDGASSSVRRGRGSAKPWQGWGNGEKKILAWNELCQPISKNRAQLATQLGYFARQGNLFPLDVPSWDKMHQQNIQNINTVWENIQHNTNALDGYKEICLETIGHCWKRFKHDIKDKYYNEYETDEERLAHVPPNVEPDQWQKLVSRWGTEESQRIAAQNAQNRANLCAHPRTGKKPFAVVREEMKEQDMPVDKLSVFRHTRQRNNTFNPDDGAAEIEETIQRLLQEVPPEKQSDVEVRNKIFEDVIGSDGHGRALCMGTGIRPAPKRLRPSSLSDKNLEVEIAKLREEATEEKVRHKEELEQVFNKSKEYVLTMLRQAGLSIPDDALDTSIQR